MNYKVFIRNWWRWERTPYGRKRVPEPNGRRTHLAYADTEDEARRIAQQYNATHDAGKLSRKAEFTKI